MNLIESIKTHLRKFTMLCVSLIRPQCKTELQENEKNGKFEKNNKTMASVEIIGERLRKRLIYLKDNQTVVERICEQINNLKYTKTGEFLLKKDKKLIIDNIEKGLLLSEDTSSKKLRELLQRIKTKLNVD